MTKVTLELITDINMDTFIENSIRGGISMISNKYAKSNNILNMCLQLDPEKPKSYILDLDANNLYGDAMSQALPTGGFKFLNKDDKRSKFPVPGINTVFSYLV